MKPFKKIFVYIMIMVNLYMFLMICLLDTLTFSPYRKLEHIAYANLVVIIIVFAIFFEKIVKNRSYLSKVFILSVFNIGLNYFLAAYFLTLFESTIHSLRVESLSQKFLPYMIETVAGYNSYVIEYSIIGLLWGLAITFLSFSGTLSRAILKLKEYINKKQPYNNWLCNVNISFLIIGILTIIISVLYYFVFRIR